MDSMIGVMMAITGSGRYSQRYDQPGTSGKTGLVCRSHNTQTEDDDDSNDDDYEDNDGDEDTTQMMTTVAKTATMMTMMTTMVLLTSINFSVQPHGMSV